MNPYNFARVQLLEILFHRPVQLIDAMKKNTYLILLCCFVSQLYAQKARPSFYAYYTHLPSAQAFEASSPTGDYADIVVVLPTGKLTFWRGTSYLPEWQTSRGKWKLEELVPRKGDGDQTMPDRANTFSHVAIVKHTLDTILIHWRYLPVFQLSAYPFAHVGFGPTDFVDEYFTITANGRVQRKLVRGTQRVDDYLTPANQHIQLIQLNFNGLRSGKLSAPALPTQQISVANKMQSKPGLYAPVAAFHFDEASGDQTSEAIAGSSYPVDGHKVLWKKGIAGTALQFDGYNSKISIPATAVQRISDLSLSTWIVIGAYPWNWVPIIQSGGKAGFFLGLNAYGFPGFRVCIEGKQYELVSKTHLERNTWYNIAATYSGEKGLLTLYINGRETELMPVPKGQLSYGAEGLRIGKANELAMPTDAVRPNRTYLSSIGFDGLIDELQVFHQYLSKERIQNNYQSYLAADGTAAQPDIQVRQFPRFSPSKQFRAYYTHLKYYETWDNLWRFGDYPDVVVEFANSPARFVFWRGTSYIPHLVNDKNQWFTNEFNETWNKSGGEGCMEPMSDKENYTSHARIVEQSPARVVVHWRVALMDVNRHIYANFDTTSGSGDWIDWYYYIYPDGVALKKMRLYTHGELNHEWQESIVLMEENQKPEEVLEKKPVFTSIDTSGIETFYNWEKTPPPSVNFNGALVHKTNLVSDWDVYTIQHFTGGNVYNSELTPYSVFCTWNHWPTAQIASDGRHASFPDRASHSSTTHVKWDFYKTEKGQRPFAEKLLMEGLSKQSSAELYQLALSWLYPAPIRKLSGISTAAYDPAQKAYQLEITQENFIFSLDASAKTPVVNPVVVISNWNTNIQCELRIDDKLLKSGIDYEQGVIYNTSGTQSLIIWIKTTSTKPLAFSIKTSTNVR